MKTKAELYNWLHSLGYSPRYSGKTQTIFLPLSFPYKQVVSLTFPNFKFIFTNAS